MNEDLRDLVGDARPHLYARLVTAIQPRRSLTVTQWADSHRILSGKASGEAGRYRSSRTPHLREIMDSLSSFSPVRRVTVMKPAQGGVTELALNWIGYIMCESPAPALVVVPTLEVRKRWVGQRLEPMLTDTPELAEIFNARKKRDGGNSEDLKDFPGGMLIIGGANSPASLSSMPIRFVLCDEVDRFPWEVGQEGDPLGLIDERTKAFMRRKVLLISTPTVKGQSRIDQEYRTSDQRELHVPCPHCGAFIVLRWKHDDDSLGLEQSETTGRVWYICRECGAGIEEHDKTQMLEEHRWIPRHPERHLHRGYHWNGLCAPIGLGFTWREMLDQWRDAQDDTTKLKRFYNTGLGQVFEEEGDGVESVTLFSRREVYPDDLQHDLIAAGVDIQKDRIELTVYGFQRHAPVEGKHQDEEAWGIDHVVLPGDTDQAEVWGSLHDELLEQGVQIAGIDAGYATKMVNAFVEKRPWCVALKGVTGMNRPLIEDERKRRHRLRQRRRKGVPQEPVGVDGGKATLYSRLRKQKPGPGYIHFPDHPAFDEEFFAQLAAEKLVTKVRNGRPFSEWVKQRPRNEGLDCAIYAMAAFHLADVIRPRASVAQKATDQPATSSSRPAPAAKTPAGGWKSR